MALTLLPAAAGTAQSTGGPALLAGTGNCQNLVDNDFTALGERAMERMIGSPGGHEAMDQLMAQMMGPANEERMHEVLGERLSGCGNPPLPGGYAGMVGTLGMMGGFSGSAGLGGFGSAGSAAPGFASGAMMARRGVYGHGDSEWSAWMLVPLAALIALAGAGLLFRNRQRTDDAPGEALSMKLANGEIDVEEFKRRRDLLEGGAR